MKNLILLFLFGTVLAFSSCDSASNSCADKMCGNNATCEDGVCDCDPGYEVNINGLCVLSDLCANVICGPDSLCVNGNCEKIIVNPCANVNCVNGNCNNGICDCDAGYSQDTTGACTIPWTSSFVGSWSVNDNCSVANYASVANVTGPTTIEFQNFSDMFNNVRAVVTSATTFNIPSAQYYSTVTGTYAYIESVGDGVLNAAGTEFSLTYKVTDLSTNTIVTCTSTWTK